MDKTTTSTDKETQKNIDAWLKGDFDEASKKEILRLQKENPQELIDAFYTHLSFGTGGLRGVMGVGTNRMNSYTVGAATQGLANYILKQPTKDKKSRRWIVSIYLIPERSPIKMTFQSENSATSWIEQQLLGGLTQSRPL